MRIAIYGRSPEHYNLSYIQQLFSELFKRDVEILIFEKLKKALGSAIASVEKLDTFTAHEDLKEKADFLISIGGDGTLLDTLTLVRDSQLPVLGINLGRLGFLASIGKEEISHAMNLLEEGSYLVDKKSLLHLHSDARIFGDTNYALNEFTIHKRDSTSMIVIHAYINDEFLNTYWADGVIVATPTGSTAYSLSCGGPVLLPASKNFVITPVAPHHLNVRPIIIPDDSVIRFEAESRQENMLCTLDSRQEVISAGFKLEIRKEEFELNLVRLPENNFLSTLRNKLLWGYDKRNF
jgi:NAD+ kinase